MMETVPNSNKLGEKANRRRPSGSGRQAGGAGRRCFWRVALCGRGMRAAAPEVVETE